MKTLKWIDQVLARLEAWLIILFLWLMVVFTFVQVMLRGLYTHGRIPWANALMGHLDWSEPFVRLLVLWLTFLGASLLTREKKHIKLDFLTPLMPPKWLPLRELVLSAVCALLSAIMFKVCLDYVRLEMAFGGKTFLRLPNWIAQLILPLGFASIFFRFSLRMVDQGIEASRSWLR